MTIYLARPVNFVLGRVDKVHFSVPRRVPCSHYGRDTYRSRKQTEANNPALLEPKLARWDPDVRDKGRKRALEANSLDCV